MDKNKLVSIMILHNDTQRTLAQAVGLSANRFNQKINSTGGAEFTQSEIMTIKERYGLSDAELVSIFFGGDVA